LKIKTLYFEFICSLFLIFFGILLFFVPDQCLQLLGIKSISTLGINIFASLIFGFGSLTYYMVYFSLPRRSLRRFVWLPVAILFALLGIVSILNPSTYILALVSICLSGLFFGLFLIRSDDPMENGISYGILGCCIANIPFCIGLIIYHNQVFDTFLPKEIIVGILALSLAFSLFLIFIINRGFPKQEKIGIVGLGFGIAITFILIGISTEAYFAIIPFLIWPFYLISKNFIADSMFMENVGSIRHKIVTLFLAVILVPLLVLTLINNYRIYNFHMESTEQTMKISGSFFKTELQDHFSLHRDTLFNILEKVEGGWPRDEKDFKYNFVGKVRLECIKNISLFDNNGKEIYRIDGKALEDYGQTEWFHSLPESGNGHPFYVVASKPFSVIYTAHYENGKLKYGVVQHTSLSVHISQNVLPSSFSQDFGYYLINSKNELASKVDSAFDEKNPFEEWIGKISINPSEEGQGKSHINHSDAAGFMWSLFDMKELDLRLLVIHSHETLRLFQNESREISVEVLILCFVVIGVLGLSLSNIITKPLITFKRLINGGDLDSKSEKSIHNISKSRDEIGSLAKAYVEERKKTLVAMKQLEGEKEYEKKLNKRLYIQKEKIVNASAEQKKINVELEILAQTLNDQKSHVESILQSIGDGIIVLSGETIINFNRASEYITGYKRADVIGKKLTEVIEIYYENGKPCKNSKLFLKRSKGSSKRILRVETAYGKQITVGILLSPVMDQEGKNVIGHVLAIRDVTEEQELDKAKTEFVSIASHQLRTPLTAIKWNTELLAKRSFGNLTKEQAELVGDIETANANLIRLVNDLLSVSRIESGKLIYDPSEVYIDEIIKTVLKASEVSFKQKKIDLKVKLDSKGLVYIDKLLIQQVIQNLIDNAIKYTPEKGKLTVNLEKTDKKVILSVKDTGMGIPASEQSKLFTKFFRATNAQTSAQGGTGLGLYIASEIIKLAKGKIDLKSEEGTGAEFIVSLPFLDKLK